MRVLELGNVVLPEIAAGVGIDSPNSGGWLSGALGALRRESDVEITYVFPFDIAKRGSINGISFCSFKRPGVLEISNELIEYFKRLLSDVMPEVVHIWGTEYSHSLCMVRAAQSLGLADKVIVSIQGLCNEYAEVYESNLPEKVLKKRTIRDILRWDNIKKQKEYFRRRGINEIELLQSIRHIIGRTAWDKACCLKRNPLLKYHFCNETLRDSFYTADKWNLDRIERHSIFCSQASYPIKGFHMAIQAIKVILNKYPDTKLKVTGPSFLEGNFKARQRRGYYFNYLRKIALDLNVAKNIVFLGALNENDMAEQYGLSHVFLSPSSIENSSNSIGEAQILGVPVVASNVGGTDTIVNNEIDGLLYPFADTDALAQAVIKIFASDEKATELSRNAILSASKRHARKENNDSLLKIYTSLMNEVNAKQP